MASDKYSDINGLALLFGASLTSENRPFGNIFGNKLHFSPPAPLPQRGYRRAGLAS
jgi:hypothetical protein